MAGQTKFKVGDLVQLKSGGPVMTIQQYAEDSTDTNHKCQWFAGKKLEDGWFPGDSLQVAPKEE